MEKYPLVFILLQALLYDFTVESHQPIHNDYYSNRRAEYSTSTDFENNPCLNYGCKQRCRNVDGMTVCGCRNGFILDQSDGKSCIENSWQHPNPAPVRSNGGFPRSPVSMHEDSDDPCENLNCAQMCVKANGRFRCGCRRGFLLNEEDQRSCDKYNGPPIHPAVDPCSVNNGGCEHKCVRTKSGGIRCKCDPGFTLAVDRKSCFQSVSNVPQITCGVYKGGCEHFCSVIGNVIQCSCKPGYLLHSDGKHCVESRESVLQVTCGLSDGGCEHTCSVVENAIQCSCRHGYRLHDNGKHCVDINECVQDNGGCDQKCVNTRGSYRCLTTCDPGYKWDARSKKCVDIDECQSEFLNSCEHICLNTEGSYLCTCHPGYVLIENRKCQGCRKGGYWSPERNGCFDCPANSFTLSEGMTSVSDCICRPGFRGSPKDGIPCVDIDECANNNFGCSDQCVNIPGGAFCSCPVGYTTDYDNKTCIDINECSLKNGGCEGLCHNTEGSFRCSCPPGLKTSNKDIYACEDIDECLERNGGCQHICNNYRGGYHCSCEKGFRLDSSMKNCTDILCPGLPTPHYSSMICKNGKQKFQSELDRYPFGTVCSVTCADGFKASDSTYMECQEDGTWKGKLANCRSKNCPPLEVPENGDVHPPSCSTEGNTVKQKCTFTCRQGYRLRGQDVFSCKNDLTWRQNMSDIPVCEHEEIRASIECVRNVTATLQPGKSSHNVTIPEPVTNMEKYEITPDTITVGKPMEFPAGKTKVLFSTSSPSSSRLAKCLTTVNVIDEEPPVFTSCPDDILIENAKVDGEIVTWEEPVVTDNVGVEFLKSSVEPNTTLKPGSYHVEYTAKDQAGNTKSCLFKIDIVRLNCGNLTDPAHGTANCMDYLYGNLCQPECDEGYMRYPSDPSFYSCGDSGLWEPSSVISDCLPYTDAVLSTCPKGSELITTEETEEEICLVCPPHTPWSATTRKCEEETSLF